MTYRPLRLSTLVAMLSLLCLAVAGCSKKTESPAPAPDNGVLPAPFSVPQAPAALTAAPVADASNGLPEDRLEPAGIDQARLPDGVELKTEPSTIPSNSKSVSK